MARDEPQIRAAVRALAADGDTPYGEVRRAPSLSIRAQFYFGDVVVVLAGWGRGGRILAPVREFRRPRIRNFAKLCIHIGFSL